MNETLPKPASSGWSWRRSGSVMLLSMAALFSVCYSQDAKPATDVADWLRSLEKLDRTNVERDASERVVKLVLPRDRTTDASMEIVSSIRSLKELKIYLSRDNRLTTNGLTALIALPELESLTLSCVAQMPQGAIQAISGFRNLRHLRIIGGQFPVEDLGWLRNSKIERLHVEYFPALGDRELEFLKDMPHLRDLRLERVGVSDRWREIVPSFKSLTNAYVRITDVGSGWKRQ